MGNKGNLIELQTKAYLYYIHNKKEYQEKLDSLFDKRINILGNYYYNYYNNNFDIEVVKNITDYKILSKYLKKSNILLSKNLAKADCIINDDIGLSIKSIYSPPLLNKSRCENMLKIDKKKCITYDINDINILINFINNYYWPLREEGLIGERFYFNKDFEKLNLSYEYILQFKSAFRRIMSYYMFVGTSYYNDSLYPADYILEVDDPFNIDTYSLLSKNQFMFNDNIYNEIFNKFVLHIRTDSSKKPLDDRFGRMFNGKKTQLLQVNLGKEK